MKTLILIKEDTFQTYNDLYIGFHKAIGSVDMRRLDELAESDLRAYFDSHVETEKYDRIVLHLHFEYLTSQLKFLATLPGLVFIDRLTSFDSVESHDQHMKFYKKIPWARVILTSYNLMEKYQAHGLDAWAVPKGYNSSVFNQVTRKRKTDIGLINNRFVKSEKYPHQQQQAQFIKKLIADYPNTVIAEALSESAYVNFLHSIQMLVCPDIGAGEYLHKTFEAMACGVMVMAFDQGETENAAIGLSDLDNIVLFRDYTEFQQKLELLSNHKEFIHKIAQNGQQLVQTKYPYITVGESIATLVAAEMRRPEDFQTGIKIFGFRV